MIRKRTIPAMMTAAMALALAAYAAERVGQWEVHDMNRPVPPVVTPGEAGKAPSDAIVLFDGTNMDQWDGGPWTVENGYMEVNGKGSIKTKKKFGSCQLHIEWAAPSEVKGESQGRGNSGVFLMDQYEVQVLDSYNNRTYADGQAASLYGQNPPLVNACRKPGEWQTYDIIFRRPIFEGDKVVRPATVTVLHNGVLVQDHFEIWGRSAHKAIAKYAPHADELPIGLQDHNNPVRFRNIWVRPLKD